MTSGRLARKADDVAEINRTEVLTGCLLDLGFRLIDLFAEHDENEHIIYNPDTLLKIFANFMTLKLIAHQCGKNN